MQFYACNNFCVLFFSAKVLLQNIPPERHECILRKGQERHPFLFAAKSVAKKDTADGPVPPSRFLGRRDAPKTKTNS